MYIHTFKPIHISMVFTHLSPENPLHAQAQHTYLLLPYPYATPLGRGRVDAMTVEDEELLRLVFLGFGY
jgi:hypothetical protein